MRNPPNKPPSKSPKSPLLRQAKRWFIVVIIGSIATFILWRYGLFGNLGLPYFSLVITVLCAIGGWKSFEKYQQIISGILGIILIGCFIWGINPHSLTDENSLDESGILDESKELDGSEEMETAIKDGSDEETSDNPTGVETLEVSQLENDGTLATIDQIEEDTKRQETKYIPSLRMEDARHLFISVSEEWEDNTDPQEYMEYILSSLDAYNDTSLKDLISKKYHDTLQSVDNISASVVNRDAEISMLVKQADELDAQIKQAYANNEPILALYDDLIKCYQQIVERAPRGEFFLQLGRPYEERILFMSRKIDDEKDSVFTCGAEAVSAFRKALTYRGELVETTSDLFYRIAKIYHYYFCGQR